MRHAPAPEYRRLAGLLVLTSLPCIAACAADPVSPAIPAAVSFADTYTERLRTGQRLPWVDPTALPDSVTWIARFLTLAPDSSVSETFVIRTRDRGNPRARVDTIRQTGVSRWDVVGDTLVRVRFLDGDGGYTPYFVFGRDTLVNGLGGPADPNGSVFVRAGR